MSVFDFFSDELRLALNDLGKSDNYIDFSFQAGNNGRKSWKQEEGEIFEISFNESQLELVFNTLNAIPGYGYSRSPKRTAKGQFMVMIKKLPQKVEAIS
jgi:hypothetical protein